MAKLGVPQEYDAWICDSRTLDKIYRCPWTNIEWQRTRNNISVGSVFVAEADRGEQCCDLLRAIYPWRTMLRVERDGDYVWDGPITGWGRPPVAQFGQRGVKVRAHDRFALSYKRKVRTTADLVDEATGILVTLLTDAGFGTAIDPYDFTVPAALGTTGLDIRREYREERLQKMYEAVVELVQTASLYFTQHLGRLVIDDGAVRAALGGNGERPKLTETSVVDLPGFDVDGLEMTTDYFIGGSTQGQGAHAFIGSSSYWAGVFATSTLEGGRSESRIVEQVDADNTALYDATRSAAPKFSVEQTLLSSEFGGVQMQKDLSNLLPGALLDVEFEDTCGFDVPMLDLAVVLHDDDVWRPTPLYSSKVRQVKIEQLDVHVGRDDSGMSEQVRLSALPYIEWDGSPVPDDWPWEAT